MGPPALHLREARKAFVKTAMPGFALKPPRGGLSEIRSGSFDQAASAVRFLRQPSQPMLVLK